ncbi:MAG: hypothetical protein AAGH76_14930 [Pseudomonadota bacterium]
MRKDRPLGVRILNAACALVFLGGVVFMMVAGFRTIATGSVLVALALVAVPVAFGGVDGPGQFLLGIVEAVIDGFLAILQGIAEIFSGLTG